MSESLILNWQEIKNVNVDEMQFLSTRTKNKLKKCGVRSLADLVQRSGGGAAYLIYGFFAREGHPLSVIEGTDVTHATYTAIWERTDGEPFVPINDYRKSVIAEIVYCNRFLWEDTDSSWIMYYSDEFPTVDSLYGITAHDLSLLLDGVADVKRKSVYKAARAFFELPEIQAAYSKHIRETIKNMCITGQAIQYNYLRLLETHGISYEDIRDGTRAYYEGKKKVIMPILWSMVDNGELIFDENTKGFKPAGRLKEEIGQNRS